MRFRPLVVIALVVALVSVSAYVAVYESDRCELRYDANGGTSCPAEMSFKKGSDVMVSVSIPKMDGYKFTGWSEDRYAEFGNINAGSSISLSKSTTLYAIWVPCGNVVVLSDAGLDDAIGLCLLFENIDLFDSVTVIAVGGNADQTQCLLNIRKVVEICNVQDKVTIVSTKNIEQNHEDTSKIHGHDCLGDLYDFEPTVPYVEFEDWIKGVDGIDHLVSLGGCTVTEKILGETKVIDFILMAGFIKCNPFYGNYEFNQKMDPDAYSRCLEHKHKDVTIDTGTCKGLDVIDWKITGDSPVDRFFKVYQKNCIDAKNPSIAIWDDIAITCLLHPHHFTTEDVTDSHGNVVTNLIFISDRYDSGVKH